jgi:hypothetical protein
MSVVLFATKLGHSYLTEGIFYVQTPYFFITGMLPCSLTKKAILYLRIAPL